jgi:arsenite methyltransferase
LGCGTGRDVYLAAGLVGQEGKVIGVDMTEEQLNVASRHEEYQRQQFGYEKSNVEFHLGPIEDLSKFGI